MTISLEQLDLKRHDKVQHTFGGYAPLWLINDHYRSRDDSYLFDVIYAHPVHGWVNQHIRYDTFTDNLYHLGEARISEEAVLALQSEDSYIVGDGDGSIPNNPANVL